LPTGLETIDLGGNVQATPMSIVKHENNVFKIFLSY